MTAAKPIKRYWLLTYPRTASNLLIRILNMEEQPGFGAQHEYLFLPTMSLRLGPCQLAGKLMDEWTDENRADLINSYQRCYASFLKLLEDAEQENKGVFVKEHVPWIIEPVSELRFVFGNTSTEETQWMIDASIGSSRSTGNNTILPDQFLKLWCPTFLIRHPALVFPSLLRTSIDHKGAEEAFLQPNLKLEMTLHWSRTLYDWYMQNLSYQSDNNGMQWPIILDADDIMTKPEVMIRYCEILGLDATKLKYEWQSTSDAERQKMPSVARRMLTTLHSSSGVVAGKTSANLDIADEAAKWKSEFGEKGGAQMERWVRDAMPDYLYMKAKRLGAQ